MKRLFQSVILLMIVVFSDQTVKAKQILYTTKVKNEVYYYFDYYTDSSGLTFEIEGVSSYITNFRIGRFSIIDSTIIIHYISEPYGNIKITSISLTSSNSDSVIKYMIGYNIFEKLFDRMMLLNMEEVASNIESNLAKPVSYKKHIPLGVEFEYLYGDTVNMDNFDTIANYRAYKTSTTPYFIITNPYSIFYSYSSIINFQEFAAFKCKADESELFVSEYFPLPEFKGFKALYLNSSISNSNSDTFKIVNKKLLIGNNNTKYINIKSYPNRIKQFIKPFKKNRNALFDFYFN